MCRISASCRTIRNSLTHGSCFSTARSSGSVKPNRDHPDAPLRPSLHSVHRKFRACSRTATPIPPTTSPAADPTRGRVANCQCFPISERWQGNYVAVQVRLLPCGAAPTPLCAARYSRAFSRPTLACEAIASAKSLIAFAENSFRGSGRRTIPQSSALPCL